MNTTDLNKILEDHDKWLNHEDGGKCADLRGEILGYVDLCGANLYRAYLDDADLGGANLEGANLGNASLNNVNLCGANLEEACLSGANLSGANLCNANLIGADLEGANVCHAYLGGANLRNARLRNSNLCGSYLDGAHLECANLYGVNLCGANLCGSDLDGAYLYRANLGGANLHRTNLGSADLRDSNIRSADIDESIKIKNKIMDAYFPLCCPEVGAFIGWKKIQDNRIVKLLIPEDAQRSSAFGRKCRCSRSIVLAIEKMDGTPEDENYIGKSFQDSNFTYKVGETVIPDSFDSDRKNECSNGIHFFLTRGEAVRY